MARLALALLVVCGATAAALPADTWALA
jgi:hypothetical protein